MDDWLKVFLSELEGLGEEQVRARLVKGFYSDAQRREVAFAWLQQKESARAAELESRRAAREAAVVEQSARALTAAERATEEANRIAHAAKKLNTRASIALIIAVTAVIISTLSLVAHLLK